MKLNAGKRILMFFHWLLSLLLVAAFAVYVIAPDFILKYYNSLVNSIGLRNLQIIGIALLAIYVLLAVGQAMLIFKRRKRSERGFITMDSSDSGKVRIAISAIEQMVRQSVGSIDGLTDMKIGIDNLEDAIGIGVTASIVNGSHVPTITMNMQRAIRQFVETNCGVAVRTVSININAVTSQPEARGRRRRGKGQEAVPAASAFQPVQSMDAPKTVDEPVIESASEPAPVFEEPAPTFSEPAPVFNEPAPVFNEPAPVEAPAEESAPAYDPDAPYVSEFAKDLAELKAREAAEAEARDDVYAPEDGYSGGDEE